MPKPQKQKETNASGLNFAAQLRTAADKMRGHMDGQESNYTTWKLARMNLAFAGLTPISAGAMATASARIAAEE
jgi:type I restriction-modification system DNA methylase subunit